VKPHRCGCYYFHFVTSHNVCRGEYVFTLHFAILFDIQWKLILMYALKLFNRAEDPA